MLVFFFRCCGALAALLLLTGPAPGLTPTQALDRYVHRVWTTDEGLPQNAVYATVTSREGYVWLGTDEGLVRFDGVRFTTFDRTNTPALRDPFVFALHEARDGALWVGTDRGGLLRYAGGRFTTFGQAEGLPAGRIQAITEDRDGVVWVGIRGGGLASVRGGSVRVLTTREGLSSDDVLAVLADGAGRVWAGTDMGLDCVDGPRIDRYDTRDGLPAGAVRALHEDRRGQLWVGTIGGLLGARVTEGGLAVQRGRRFTEVSVDWPVASRAVMDIHEDRSGTLWLGTAGGGLVRVAGGRVAHWLLGATPADDMVYGVAEDAEGNLWLGTAPGGLHRLRDSTVRTLTAADGLADEVVESLFEGRDGRRWIGTHAGGLCLVDDARVTCRTTTDGLSHPRVNALLDDEDGSLWVGTQGGLDRLLGARISRIGTAEGLPVAHVNALLRARDGRLWVGTWGGGVARERDPHGGRFGALAGVSGPYVTTLLEDARGDVWIGTTDGLFHWEAGAPDRPAARRLTAGIEALHLDREGMLWIGTRRDGLYRSADGGLVQYTTREGLFDNLVGTIQEDDEGYFWFTCNRGIFRVARQQLMDVAARRRVSVESRAFDTSDGMRNRECNFGQGRWRMRDGHLWFATVGGVVMVDPRRLPRNTVAPVVHLEQVTVDGEAVPTDREATLASGFRRLEFAFVGVSLSAPARVRYRFQLEGFDPEWLDGRDARTASYTNLTPGRYRFRVSAANGDGVWSQTGSSFAFQVTGPLWQQPRVLATFGGLLALTVSGLGYRRVRVLRREQRQQAAFARELIRLQEHERQRLAADLHDGIGQHLLVIKNWASLSLAVLDTPGRARPLLEDIVETTTASIRDIRTMTHALQPYDLTHVGLRAVLQGMLARVADASGLALVTEIEDVTLPPDAQIHLFRIIQEATTNVVKHAGARRLQVTLRQVPGAVEAVVGDDGRGFPAGTAADGPNGFGLRSLAERTRLLGGWHVIETGTSGTVVRVVVPQPDEAPPRVS